MYKSPVHGLCVQIMRFAIIYILAVLLLSEVARTDGSVCEAGTREKQYDPPSRLRCGGTCGCVSEGGSIGYIQSHADFTYDKSDTYKNNDDCWWIASGSASLYVTFFHYEFEAGDHINLFYCNDLSCTDPRVIAYKGLYEEHRAPAGFNNIKVTFTSDGSGVAKGFKGLWNSGYNEVCTWCLAGTYNDIPGAFTCKNNPPNSQTEDKAPNFQCNTGYTLSSDGVACETCMRGTYKSAVGRQSCTVCPANTNTPAVGSKDVTDCECIQGYTATSNGVACTACVEGDDVCSSACVQGQYNSADDGSKTCAECPEYTFSVAGSMALTDCKCIAGYTADSDGVACSACAYGTYKSDVGSSPCDE